MEPDTVGALFEREPVRYGLRGDPYLWRELRARFADVPLPPEWDELEELLHTAIEHSLNEHTSISGKPDFTQTIYVAEFDPGHGLSAGSVCLPWWAGTAIPILLDRHAGGTDHLEPLNRLANGGMLWMTLSELRKQTNHLPGALPVVSRHDYHCVPVQAVAVVDGQLVLLPYSV